MFGQYDQKREDLKCDHIKRRTQYYNFFPHLDAPRTKEYFVFTLNFVSSELVDVAKNSPDSGYPDGEHPNGDPKAFYENLPFHGAPLKQVSLVPHITNKGLLPHSKTKTCCLISFFIVIEKCLWQQV